MRRITVIGLVFALLSLAGLPALSQAQETFTLDEQAALHEVATALKHFTNLDTYQLTGEQDLDQVIRSYQNDQLVVTINQRLISDNEVAIERQPGNDFHNMRTESHQRIEISTTATGQKTETQVLDGLITRFIAVDNRFYVKMEGPPEFAGVMPADWVDITDGTTGYPGLELFDLTAMMKLSQLSEAQYGDNLLESAIDISILDPVILDDQTFKHYSVTFDNTLALEELGVDNLAEMFAGFPDMVDIDTLIELMINSDSTTYTIDYLINVETGILHSYEQITQMEIDVTDAIPSLAAQGVTMIIQQTLQQKLYVSGFNEPVDITTPRIN